MSHIVFDRSRRVTVFDHGAQALFQPVIITSYSPLLEIDCNMHKSNSTFFTDLDVSRAHLIAALFRPILSITGLGGRLGIALGATACNFRREIKAYQGYEVWSRVLTWDEKWLYIVSHFVQRGLSKKTQYTLQRDSGPTGKRTSEPKMPDSKRLFATAISKYVFKEGRITVAPDQVLRQLHLLPDEPTQNGLAKSENILQVTAEGKRDEDNTKKFPHVLSSISIEVDDGTNWDFGRVELERDRGLQIANSFASLDRLDDVFTGDSWPALTGF
jgi:hypothetical protein